MGKEKKIKLDEMQIGERYCFFYSPNSPFVVTRMDSFGIHVLFLDTNDEGLLRYYDDWNIYHKPYTSLEKELL